MRITRETGQFQVVPTVIVVSFYVVYYNCRHCGQGFYIMSATSMSGLWAAVNMYRQAGQIDCDGVNVRQIHLHRIGGFFAQ